MKAARTAPDPSPAALEPRPVGFATTRSEAAGLGLIAVQVVSSINGVVRKRPVRFLSFQWPVAALYGGVSGHLVLFVQSDNPGGDGDKTGAKASLNSST
jgi:hypothetical protein